MTFEELVEGARQSQATLVLNHMKKYGNITSLEAFSLYGVTRLSGRIYDLRKRGYIIKGTTETAVNRFGKKVKYSRYELAA